MYFREEAAFKFNRTVFSLKPLYKLILIIIQVCFLFLVFVFLVLVSKKENWHQSPYLTLSLKLPAGELSLLVSGLEVDRLLLMFLCFAGSCSPAQTEAIPQLHPETSLSCHLGFTSDAIDFSANDVFKTRTGFDTSIGENHFI